MRSIAGYPTSTLAHGPTLLLDGHDLTEEGVGFGVPVALRGDTAVFPRTETRTAGDASANLGTGTPAPCGAPDGGCAPAASPPHVVTYRLDLAERLVFGARRSRVTVAGVGGWMAPPLLDRLHDHLSRLHRRHPALRPVLDAGGDSLRRALGMSTRFTATRSAGSVPVTYERRAHGSLAVTVDPTGVTDPGVTTVAVMNELGATVFTEYRDSGGLLLAGERIESWAEVHAEWAAFASPALDLEFVGAAVQGARLFRGRELAPGRLAWTGFAYLLTPPWKPFSYEVRVRGRGGGGRTRLPNWSLA